MPSERSTDLWGGATHHSQNDDSTAQSLTTRLFGDSVAIKTGFETLSYTTGAIAFAGLQSLACSYLPGSSFLPFSISPSTISTAVAGLMGTGVATAGYSYFKAQRAKDEEGKTAALCEGASCLTGLATAGLAETVKVRAKQ